MHRLRRMRAGMPGRCDQAGHRAGPREVARGEYRICQVLAEYHPEERIPARRQGFRGHGRQIREIFFSGSGYRRLIEYCLQLNPNRADIAETAPQNVQTGRKSLIFTDNVLYWAHYSRTRQPAYGPYGFPCKTSNRGVAVPRAGCVTENA